MPEIRNMTAEEVATRTGRFGALKPMSTAKKLADEGVPLEALDIIFANKLMPVILEKTANPFGNASPITGAGGMSLHVSVCPPGQGPCLHNHSSTFETFVCLDGRWEFSVGDEGQQTVVLEKWDTFSCPPMVYRGFRNVDSKDSVLMTIISGPPDARDDVTLPPIIEKRLAAIGANVVPAISKIVKFDKAK